MNRYLLSALVVSTLFLIISGLFWNDIITAAVDHPGGSVSFYIDSYGEVLPTIDSEVARAHRVFERVRAVADKNTRRLPKLVVVDSKADPWAIALPDGHIVLSRKAIAICHRQTSQGEAEARLAFVMGHELAHLARDDFWHREVFAFVANIRGAENIAQVLRKEQSKSIEKELAADDAGFIYAALAGYPVDRLIRTIDGKPQFFEYWMHQTHRRANGKHPTIKKRAELLLWRLGDLKDKIVLFEYGVRLSHFDYCDDAIYFLRAFQKTFPGREVLNNLGYCYLQIARQAMEPERAYFYWTPLLMDAETRVKFLLRRGGLSIKMLRQAASGTAQGFLREATDYLQRAVNADPGYLPAKINLAVAYLYLGRPHSA
ncbi:MAG: M48 family metalloprotease [bacterium]|nr:M48 family metalloprotease [bacterium]